MGTPGRFIDLDFYFDPRIAFGSSFSPIPKRFACFALGWFLFIQNCSMW